MTEEYKYFLGGLDMTDYEVVSLRILHKPTQQVEI